MSGMMFLKFFFIDQPKFIDLDTSLKKKKKKKQLILMMFFAVF